MKITLANYTSVSYVNIETPHERLTEKLEPHVVWAEVPQALRDSAQALRDKIAHLERRAGRLETAAAFLEAR
jgi:hypothetical protein